MSVTSQPRPGHGALITGAVGALLMVLAAIFFAMVGASLRKGAPELYFNLYAGFGGIGGIMLAVGSFSASPRYGGNHVAVGVFAILAALGAIGSRFLPDLIAFNRPSDAVMGILGLSVGTLFLLSVAGAVANRRNARGGPKLRVLTAASWLYLVAVIATGVSLKLLLGEDPRKGANVGSVALVTIVAALICHGIGLLQLRKVQPGGIEPQNARAA